MTIRKHHLQEPIYSDYLLRPINQTLLDKHLETRKRDTIPPGLIQLDQIDQKNSNSHISLCKER